MESSPEVNSSDVGSGHVPLSNSSQCQMAWTHGTETYWEGKVLSVFWPVISDVALRACPLVSTLLYVPEEENTRCPTSQCRVSTMPAEPFKFGATLTVGGKNICQVP